MSVSVTENQISGSIVTGLDIYSICGLGHKWFWAIYPEQVGDGSAPVQTGFERSKSRALDRLRGILGGPGVKISPRFARVAYRRLRAEKRMSECRPVGTASVLITYLYNVERIRGGKIRVNRFRVIKYTSRRVYLLRNRDGYSIYDRAGRLQEDVQEATGEWNFTAGEEWRHWAESLRTVDRLKLEKRGTTLTSDGLRFYSDLRQVWTESLGGDSPTTDQPWWALVLGLEHPCNYYRIRESYRRLAKEFHPDAGGSPEEFVHLEKAYRAGMESLRVR